MNSDAHWAACDICNDMISKGKREALAARSSDENANGPIPYALVYMLHITAFWIGDLRHHPSSEHKDDEPAVH